MTVTSFVLRAAFDRDECARRFRIPPYVDRHVPATG
jgi:hypothetical protein